MGILNEQQLTRARTYISSNRGRNPISLLMELGQLLHVTPEFNTREDETSTVHQHVFVCEVRFAQFTESADGYNKRRVKSEAAKHMIEFLQLATPSSCLSRGGREFETARKSANLGQPYTMQRTSASATSNESNDYIGNAVGNLQEYCAANELELPLYTFTQEQSPGNNSRYTAAVKIPGYPSMEAEPKSSKAEAKQLAAYKMYTALQNGREDRTDVTTIQASDDPLDSLKNSFKNFSLKDGGKPSSAKGKAMNQVIEVMKEVVSDSTCKDALSGNKYSAVEKVTMIASSGKFEIAFHHEENADGTSHLCLLEAKNGLCLVCHGIADTKPQAIERAADSLLSLIDFFANST